MEFEDSEQERSFRRTLEIEQAQAHIRENRLHLLREYLERSPDNVHVRTLQDNFLSIAIQHDNVEAVRILLDAGMSPLEDDSRGHCFLTALEHASAHGNRDIWRLLVDRLIATTPTGIVICGHDEQELLEHSLIEAACSGNTVIVAEFLDAFEWTHATLLNTLVCAATRWRADVVEMLIRKVRFDEEGLRKALDFSMDDRINVPDIPGQHVYFGQYDIEQHYRIVSTLIHISGINLSLEGSNLLCKATEGIDKQGGLRALLEKGADPNTQWEDGSTALHRFAFPLSTDPMTRPEIVFFQESDPLQGYQPHESGIRLLVNYGASITIRDNLGATPSHLAAEGSSTDIFLRYYLPAESDWMQTNKYGESLLHYAAAGGKHKTLEYLLSRGSSLDVNVSGNTGWTPLACALAPNSRVYKTEYAAVKSARLLLSLESSTSFVTTHGLTIFHVLGSYQDRNESSVPENRAPGPAPAPWMKVPGNGPHRGRLSPVMMPEAAYQERYGLLDEDCSAAQLARHLLSLYSHLLPLIDSPARVFVGSAPYWQHPFHRIAWGGMLDVTITKTQTKKVIYKSAPAWQVDSNAFDRNSIMSDWTPLRWAVHHKAAAVVKLLREYGADYKPDEGEDMTP